MSEPFDDTAKIFYRRLFQKWGMRVESQREIFFRARSIDLVVSCTEKDRKRLSGTVFSHFRRLNSIELKGSDDPVTEKSYNRAVMRAWGLGGLDVQAEKKRREKRQLEGRSDALPSEEMGSALQISDLLVRHPSDRTLTIISVVRPDKILADERLRFKATEEPGIYFCDEQLPKWIICPSELRVIEGNYPLLPLSKGEKLKEFIKCCLDEGMIEYLQLVLDIGLAEEPDIMWSTLLEATEMEIKVSEETWPKIDKFFRVMPEAMEKLPTIRGMIAQKEREAQQQAQQQVQRLIAQKEREAQLQAQEAQREAQRLIAQKEREAQQQAQEAQQKAEQEALRVIVARQLRLKFGEVSPQVMSRIKETENNEQLLRWLDQLVLAASLADTDFGATES